jgi:hypothetical protein
VVDLLGRPAAEMSAAMQQDFEEADDAGLVDLDAGITNRTTVIGRAKRWSSGSRRGH